MKQFLLTVAGVFVGLLLFVVVVPLALIAIAVGASRPAPLPAKSVLTLDLRGGLTDQDPPDGLPFLGGRGLSVMGVEETLRRAAADGQVGGVLVRLPEAGISPAVADELRLSFQAFRASGKPMLAYSQGIYPEGVATATYELGAASGDLWMQPSASFQATGLAQQDLFLKRFFDKYGVVADYQQRYEYKNAVNPYLYDDYTPAHREAELSWMGSVYATTLAAAAADRKLSPDALKATIEAGPYSADEAKAKGLVDNVGEEREAEAAILKAAGNGAKLADFSDYAQRARAAQGASFAAAPTIALIQAEGDIVTGTAGHGSPLGGGGATIYADDLAKAFYKAIDDKDVKAIVFRLNSPGGSDTASEEILSAVHCAAQAAAASRGGGQHGRSTAPPGGYWISSGRANVIVAEPSTLTGSIGVFGGKFALGPALAKYGFDMDDLTVGGDYADSGGSQGAMSPSQTAAFRGLDRTRIYNGSVARVAEGRKMTVQQVGDIAKGHVWTGAAQAKSLGLVDYLGGFAQAVARAKALAGIKGAARLKPFATSANPFAAIARLFGAGADSARLMAAASELAQDPDARALIESLHDARLREAGATVLAPMPPLSGR